MALHKLTLGFALLLLALGVDADAGDADAKAEIAFLIDAIGASGCTFVRNGKQHSARNAEEHIRMKYRRAKRYASTAELFIERLASKSSMSKKPYWMQCPGAEPVQSGDWLKAELERYREHAEQSGT